MTEVSALLIGAQKAGTTSLYRYIEQHSQIAFSYVKEVTYFLDAEAYARGVDYYHEFFPKAADNVLLMGSHVHLLASEEAPARVLEYNKNMKFIVLLREPVSRAWSAFNYAIANGWESEQTSFLDSLKLERARMQSNNRRERFDLAYFHNGLYWHHLTRWLEYFDADRFLLIRTKDLIKEPEVCLRRVWAFLDVDPDNSIDTSRQYNRARSMRWNWLTDLLYNKDSRMKSGLGKILPLKLRVWIRRRLIPLMLRANTVDSDESEAPAEACSMLADYYRQDLGKLASEFGIRFN